LILKISLNEIKGKMLKLQIIQIIVKIDQICTTSNRHNYFLIQCVIIIFEKANKTHKIAQALGLLLLE
jgi:uncharacterized protein YccT (UPF0319 family)